MAHLPGMWTISAIYACHIIIVSNFSRIIGRRALDIPWIWCTMNRHVGAPSRHPHWIVYAVHQLNSNPWYCPHNDANAWWSPRRLDSFSASAVWFFPLESGKKFGWTFDYCTITGCMALMVMLTFVFFQCFDAFGWISWCQLQTGLDVNIKL